MELNIWKFSEAKLKFSEAVDKYKDLLNIKVENKWDFEIISSWRKELKALRVDFQKFAKDARDEANKFSKSVIEQEKEWLAIIEPVEEALKAKEDEFKERQEIEKRKLLLPLRIEELWKINISMKDEDLLKMDDKTFEWFLLEQKQLFLEEKERKIKEEQDKIEAEKRKQEEEKQRQKEIEEAKEKARVEAEQKAQKEKEEAEQKHLAEIERLKQEQIEKEQKAKQEQEAKEKVQKLEQERLEKETGYKNFLKENEWMFDKIIKEDWKIVLYKKVAEFNI